MYNPTKPLYHVFIYYSKLRSLKYFSTQVVVNREERGINGSFIFTFHCTVQCVGMDAIITGIAFWKIKEMKVVLTVSHNIKGRMGVK